MENVDNTDSKLNKKFQFELEREKIRSDFKLEMEREKSKFQMALAEKQAEIEKEKGEFQLALAKKQTEIEKINKLKWQLTTIFKQNYPCSQRLNVESKFTIAFIFCL